MPCIWCALSEALSAGGTLHVCNINAHLHESSLQQQEILNENSTSPQVIHISNRFLQNGLLSAELPDFQFENPDVLQTLIVLDLPLVEGRLLDLDFLIQQS